MPKCSSCITSRHARDGMHVPHERLPRILQPAGGAGGLACAHRCK